ncbi:MAG TPA: NAD(P)-dependent oxidoreductase [Acidimicrobiales bacterium]|nr:NAD(P)-dependent oxidoreductase [Acidimicrobiales bacterium]
MIPAGNSTIGFIGVGSMGAPIARNLLRAGTSLLVHDRIPERVEALVENGAVAAAGVAEVAGAGVVCVSLPGPAEVEAVCLGRAGLLAQMQPGSALVNLSTISLDSCRRLDEAARSQGVAYVDAPVTGAADGARDASLVLMVGARPEAFALVTPIFDVIGQRAVLVGEPPAGTAAKLLTNMLWFVHVVALSEALALGSAVGVAPELLAQVVRKSAGASWVAEHDLDNLLAGDDDVSFTLELCCKDLRLIGEFAAEVDYAASLATVARRWFERARERFGPGAGELAVSRIVERDAGVSIRASVPAEA